MDVSLHLATLFFFFYLFMTLIKKSVIFNIVKTVIEWAPKRVEYHTSDGLLINHRPPGRDIINVFCKRESTQMMKTLKKNVLKWNDRNYFNLAAKSLQSCPTLCDPIESSPPGSPIPGILQARTLEWVAISFSKAWKWKVKVKLLSRIRLLATPWTAAHQAPRSTGFARQEYWSGCHCFLHFNLSSPFIHRIFITGKSEL